jgi:hypothetical protein
LKWARFDERLKTLQVFAVSTLTREMLRECGDYIDIRDRRAGHSLLQNLEESLLATIGVRLAS